MSGAYERELAAHERKGEIGPLEATMALLKGEVIQHTPAELANITKVRQTSSRNGEAGGGGEERKAEMATLDSFATLHACSGMSGEGL